MWVISGLLDKFMVKSEGRQPLIIFPQLNTNRFRPYEALKAMLYTIFVRQIIDVALTIFH